MKIFESLAKVPSTQAELSVLEAQLVNDAKKECTLHAIADSGSQIAEAATIFINNL
jgi:hypothetical protein